MCSGFPPPSDLGGARRSAARDGGPVPGSRLRMASAGLADARHATAATFVFKFLGSFLVLGSVVLSSACASSGTAGVPRPRPFPGAAGPPVEAAAPAPAPAPVEPAPADA